MDWLQIGIARGSTSTTHLYFNSRTSYKPQSAVAEGKSIAPALQSTTTAPLALSHGPHLERDFDTLNFPRANKDVHIPMTALQDHLQVLFVFSSGLTKHTDNPEGLCLFTHEFLDVFNKSSELLQIQFLSPPLSPTTVIITKPRIQISPKAACEHVVSLVHASTQQKHDWSRPLTPSSIQDVYMALMKTGHQYGWLSAASGSVTNEGFSNHVGTL
ncbi:hypothetical protein BD289DRAFT_439478 [Coniella lustricola]|uniref:Uncharacterized protein n=1 Tax=Coniella lustricola TaxID=2025994 RepID=A0A2T3A1N0_9PEZI|nr:hypothetical protein BD289DRAFT_439478 [Coniella lustricola]